MLKLAMGYDLSNGTHVPTRAAVWQDHVMCLVFGQIFGLERPLVLLLVSSTCVYLHKTDLLYVQEVFKLFLGL